MTDPVGNAESMRGRILRFIAAMAPPLEPGNTTVTGPERLIDDLGFDSVRLIELMMVLERAFGLPTHHPEQLAEVYRVDDVVALTLSASEPEGAA
jgi:acyl carrier protein